MLNRAPGKGNDVRPRLQFQDYKHEPQEREETRFVARKRWTSGILWFGIVKFRTSGSKVNSCRASAPLSSHEIDGVRKEKERLTAASLSLYGFLSLNAAVLYNLSGPIFSLSLWRILFILAQLQPLTAVPHLWWKRKYSS